MAGLKSRDFAILQVQRAGAGGGVRCSVECFEALGGWLSAGPVDWLCTAQSISQRLFYPGSVHKLALWSSA
jgi:hypothetical protein